MPDCATILGAAHTTPPGPRRRAIGTLAGGTMPHCPAYDAENRLTTVSGATNASFTYDGDGNRVKTIFGTAPATYYVGNHFEWITSTLTMVKYYYAGGQRVAMRKGSSTLSFLLGDHLGSTAITANSSGAKVAELRYKPWGEARYTYNTTPTSYQFTGQRNDYYIGLYFYNARYYDPALGRFLAADTIVPDPANPQSLNRYSYVLNSPLRYTDPTGHFTDDELASLLGDNWQELMQLWEEYDPYWYYILRYVLEGGYTMTASEAYLPGVNTGGWSNTGTERLFITFAGKGKDIQAFEYVMNEKTGRMIQQQSQGKLVHWQGKGAYAIKGPGDVGDIGSAALFKQFMEYSSIGLGTGVPQPQFDYSSGNPSLEGWNLVQMSLGPLQYKGSAAEFVTWMGGTPSWGDGMEMTVDVGLLLTSSGLGLAKFAADVIVSYNAMASDTNAYKTVKYPLPR
jgi:RHS repeat-associated protein